MWLESSILDSLLTVMHFYIQAHETLSKKSRLLTGSHQTRQTAQDQSDGQTRTASRVSLPVNSEAHLCAPSPCGAAV